MPFRFQSIRFKAMTGLVGVLAAASASIAQAQPSETCELAGAAPSIGEGSFNFDNTTAAPNLPSFYNDVFCYSSSKVVHDLWYKYAPTQNGTAIISVCGSAGDTVVSLHTVSCEDNALICGQKFSDHACLGSGASSVEQDVVIGQQYLIRVAGVIFNNSTEDTFAKGPGVLSIRVAQRPTNEVCGLAQSIGVGATLVDLALAITDEPNRSRCAYSGPGGGHVSTHDLWYSYTPTHTGYATVYGSGYPNTANYASVAISVYPSCNSSAQALSETDPVNADITGKTLFPVTSGTTVYIRVAGQGFEPQWWGRFNLNVATAPAPPSNNSCTTPTIITQGSTPFTTVNANNDCFASSVICRTGSPDVWYSFVPTSDGSAVFTVSNAGIWNMALLRTCPVPPPLDSILLTTNSGSLLDASDAICRTNSSTANAASPLRACVQAGVQYYLRVASSIGGGTINFSLQPLSTYSLPSNGVPETGDVTCPNTLNQFPTCATTLQALMTNIPVVGQFANFDSDWYTYVLPGSGSMSLTINGQSQFDMNVELYQNTPGNPSCAKTLIASTGTAAACSASFTLQAPGLQGGTTYYVRITSPTSEIANCTNNGYWLRAAVLCIADHNHSGTVTVQDIFSFLSAWFGGNISADANSSGTVTVQDIFFFLSRWFAGC